MITLDDALRALRLPRSSARGSSPPTATWVTQRVAYDRLVLSACHPLYSAAKRIVVFAKLVRRDAAEGTAA